MAPDQFSEQLLKALEQNTKLFSSLGNELKFQLKTVVDSQVENMGLVTREEFDAMRASLDRALSRIENLESDKQQTEPDQTRAIKG